MLLDITKLSSNLKLKDNQLLTKIAKGIKHVTEQRIYNNNSIDDARAEIPDNVSDLKRHCLKNKHSILKNVPEPKFVNHSYIGSISTKEPI